MGKDSIASACKYGAAKTERRGGEPGGLEKPERVAEDLTGARKLSWVGVQVPKGWGEENVAWKISEVRSTPR